MSPSSQLKALLTAVAVMGAGVLASPTQAGDFDDGFDSSYRRPRVERQVTITTVTRRDVDHGPSYGRADFDDDDHEPVYRRRHHERRYAQPVFYGRPVYGRPVFDHDECRVIIKKRVNAWGDVVIKRIKRCD
jgi:hypothetical protein